MTVAAKRAWLAQQIDSKLPDVKVFPYRPKGTRGLSGWLELQSVDTEDCTFNELRTQFNVVILLGSDQATFEKFFDAIAKDLIELLADLGRGITLRPFTESVDGGEAFCLVATITTESEAA